MSSEKINIESVIADILKEWGDERVINAKSILTRYDAVGSDNLRAGLQSWDVEINGDNLSVGFGFVNPSGNQRDASKYYKYVDEGVAGIGGGKKSAITTGRYKYKNAFVNRFMIASIQDWITDKGILIRKSKGQSTKSVISQTRSAAYLMAKSIKRTGIGKTMFWSDTFNQKAYNDLVDRIEKATGKSYNLTFKDI